MLSVNAIILLLVLSFSFPYNTRCSPVNRERNRLNAIPSPDIIENIRKEVSKSDSIENQMLNRAYYGRHYCGRELIKALVIVCSSQDYYDSGSVEYENNVEPKSESFGSNRERVKRGVIDECCTKRCNFEDLTKYCH